MTSEFRCASMKNSENFKKSNGNENNSFCVKGKWVFIRQNEIALI